MQGRSCKLVRCARSYRVGEGKRCIIAPIIAEPLVRGNSLRQKQFLAPGE